MIVELPGVDPKSIHVVAADRVLVVAGERCRPGLIGRYQQMELEYGPFERRISLAEPVDTAAATARYEKGTPKRCFALSDKRAVSRPTARRAVLDNPTSPARHECLTQNVSPKDIPVNQYVRLGNEKHAQRNAGDQPSGSPVAEHGVGEPHAGKFELCGRALDAIAQRKIGTIKGSAVNLVAIAKP